mgnify:CR=1 FL=1
MAEEQKKAGAPSQKKVAVKKGAPAHVTTEAVKKGEELTRIEKIKKWFREMKSELKKVSWTPFKEVSKSFKLVVATVVAVAAVIMLIGLLAKTAILITEYALERRRKGLGIVEAAYAAAEARLRPILMTVLTMIIGMIPLVIMTGAGANGNRTIGIAVIGGMFVGTLAILLTVPVFFIFFEWVQEKIRPAMIEEPDAQVLMERERIRHEREEREQRHKEKH